jgi:lipopolysaccharide/colanic/teichoic acid biosynthesis glycosyltransferase
MKRILDIVVASIALVLVLPFLVVAALAVRLTSKGPAFFAHKRCGYRKVPFQCIKLRTMVPNAQDWLEQDLALKAKYKENGFKLHSKEDPRVTNLGRFLRRSHLDELPQLINVIRGEMSLVGPRPIVDEELEWYGEDQDELLSIRPGIFGPWTVLGQKRPEYPVRASIELGYIRRTSRAKDLGLLWGHIPVLLMGQSEEVGHD